MKQAQMGRVITQGICSEGAEESTRKVLSRRSIQYHLLLGLAHIIMFFTHIASVWATSAGNPREEMQSEASLWKEIVNMQKLRDKKGVGLTESRYMLDLFTKSNPELKGVSEHRYFLYIYREKDYADLDIAKYCMDDIQYKVYVPMGIHSLRILDSNTEQDESARKQRNRVFAKLLYSLFRLDFTSLVIEGIGIGPEDQEVLMLQGIKNSVLKVDRLVFRNVTIETIRVFFKRLSNVSVGRLCIEGCGIIRLDDAVTSGCKYEIGGLEFTEVKIAPDNYQAFLGRVSHIEHLNMYWVQFISMQVLRDLLSMLKGTLEIDLGMYKQVPETIWSECANQIRQLYLMNVGHLASIEEEFRDTSSVFSSLTTLTLSVRHSQLLDASLLSSIIIQVKKYYGGVKNVIILGKMNMEGVKKAIRDKESGIAQILQEHADTHFTFTDSTGIDPSRKYLLFIPLSLYNKITAVKDLGSRLGALGEISNWNWNKQGGAQMLCTRCKARKDGYVTQLGTGGIICDYNMRYNIQRQANVSTDADKNVCLISTQHIWYPKYVIFLSQELGGRVYLTTIRDITEVSQKRGKGLMLAGGPKAKSAKRSAVSTRPIQDAAIGTSIASTSATWQPQQEPHPGTSGYMEECTAKYTYYTPSQPPTAKQPRYEPAISNRNTFEQPMVPGGAQGVGQSEFMGMPGQSTLSWEDESQVYMNTTITDSLCGYRSQHWLDDLAEEALRPAPVLQEIDQLEYMEMPRQIEMQLDEELQMYMDAEMALSQNESRPRDWLDVMLEEIITPVAQQAEQPQTMAMFGGHPVLTNEDLERYLGGYITEPEEEFVWTQL